MTLKRIAAKITPTNAHLITLSDEESVRNFHVTYGIFAHWFSLNQMFLIKFSVSFATEVEKTRPSHVFLNRGLRSTRKLKESNRKPFFSNGQRTWLEIPVVIMGNLYPCSFECLKSVAVMACIWLPPFLFLIFYFSVVCFK